MCDEDCKVYCFPLILIGSEVLPYPSSFMSPKMSTNSGISVFWPLYIRKCLYFERMQSEMMPRLGADSPKV